MTLGSGAHNYGDLNLPASVSASATADNGQTFIFQVDINQDNVGLYAEPQKVYALSASEGEYPAGSVYAMLTIITY